MKNSKYDIVIYYNDDETKVSVSKESEFDKLVKLIKLVFSPLEQINFQLLYKSTDLMKEFTSEKLHKVFKKEEVDTPSDEQIEIIELYVKEKKEDVQFLEFVCKFNKIEKHFKMEKGLSFQKFKFKILTTYPDLEQENYSLLFNNIDITNIFSDDKVIIDIFSKENLSDKIKINILTKPKHFVEFHKKCSFCHIQKAISICNKCATASCGECFNKDTHFSNRNLCFIQINNFKQFEQNTLSEFLKLLMNKKDENEKLQSNHFFEIINDKMSVFNKKFNEMTEIINQIKNYQYTNLIDQINFLKSFYPEDLEKKIMDLYKIILDYKDNPYYDCEESMKKVLELEKFLNDFKIMFGEYKIHLDNFSEKYLKCMKINNNIIECLKNSFMETKSVFRKIENKEKYIPIMKIYDHTSVLVYDHTTEKFSLMNFLDKHKFKENFNNYVQINYAKKLFIITGNPCQKFFVYDYETNELEFINSLKFSHNWWPVMIIKPSEEPLYKISIFCFSGTYTKKCEELVFTIKKKIEPENDQSMVNIHEVKEENNNKISDITLEWKEIPSLSNCHGQGAAYLFNQSVVYILFGYDSKFSSTSSIERLDLNLKGNWEQVQFVNPNRINALLYYHSVMKCDENSFFIFGGMKEVNVPDVIYKYNLITNEMTKTEYDIPVKETKFYNEKTFMCLDKEEYIFPKENLGKTLRLKKDETIQKLASKENNNKAQSMFAIFDAFNNLHLVNTKVFNYQIKKYSEI